MNVFLGETTSNSISSITAVIPARAGSKGFPDKNIMCLGNLPLIEHSILLALSVHAIDFIVVTTDSIEILLLKNKYPTVLFIHRPVHLARDDSSLFEVIEHVFLNVEFNVGINPSFLILQPTTPFRLPQNISNALSFAKRSHVSSLISVVPMRQHPSECIRIEKRDWHLLVRPPSGSTRRQDFEHNYYFISGSFYYSTLQRLQDLNSACFKNGSSLWNSNEPVAIDIDSPVDLHLAVNLFEYMANLGYTYDSKDWLH